MAQPKMGHITCSQCNGGYNSERELREHVQTAHRRFVPELSTFQDPGTHPNSLENQLGTLKEVSETTRPNRGHGELTGRLIKVQDQERRRIARELHDGMGQKIALLKMNLDKLVRLEILSPAPAEILSQSVALAETMSMELRTVAYLLHPPLLDELGLVSALRTLVDGFSQRSGIGTSLQIDDALGRLPSEVEISIYRIAQECLTNIHRHSGSPTARIRVERLPTQIHVEIQDHGSGMTAEKRTTGSGVGLGGMRERAIQLGGTLEIKSDGKGTTVIARLPYRIN